MFYSETSQLIYIDVIYWCLCCCFKNNVTSWRIWLFFLYWIHVFGLNICFYSLMPSMIISSCSGHLIQVFSHRAQAQSLLMLMRFWGGKHISFSCISSVSHACFLFFHLISFKEVTNFFEFFFEVFIILWRLFSGNHKAHCESSRSLCTFPVLC